jgi:hypothetical protein
VQDPLSRHPEATEASGRRRWALKYPRPRHLPDGTVLILPQLRRAADCTSTCPTPRPLDASSAGHPSLVRRIRQPRHPPTRQACRSTATS